MSPGWSSCRGDRAPTAAAELRPELFVEIDLGTRRQRQVERDFLLDLRGNGGCLIGVIERPVCLLGEAIGLERYAAHPRGCTAAARDRGFNEQIRMAVFLQESAEPMEMALAHIAQGKPPGEITDRC